MAKQTNLESVDSSYTVLYLFFTILCSAVVSFAFKEASVPVLFSLIGYATLSYFVWDLIRQLFYPGQAVILYIITFFILPVLMNYLFQNSIGTLAVIIYVTANILALLFDVIYECIVKKRLPKKVLRRLLVADATVDRSIAPLSVKHVQLTEIKGMVIAIGLILLYFIAVFIFMYSAG